jgi:hypothetical protein
MVLGLMKSPWVTLAAVLLAGLAIGAAIAGRPTNPAHDSRVRSVPTTTEITTASITAVSSAVTTTTAVASMTTSTMSTTTTTTAEIAPTTTTEPTPTTAPGPDRSTVLVLVANADSASGIARAEAAHLVTLGYSKPLTADATGPQKESVVYARAGHEDEGLLLLADAGLSADRLRPFPNQAFTTRDDQANVILALGNDWQA